MTCMARSEITYGEPLEAINLAGSWNDLENKKACGWPWTRYNIEMLMARPQIWHFVAYLYLANRCATRETSPCRVVLHLVMLEKKNYEKALGEYTHVSFVWNVVWLTWLLIKYPQTHETAPSCREGHEKQTFIKTFQRCYRHNLYICKRLMVCVI